MAPADARSDGAAGSPTRTRRRSARSVFAFAAGTLARSFVEPDVAASPQGKSLAARDRRAASQSATISAMERCTAVSPAIAFEPGVLRGVPRLR